MTLRYQGFAVFGLGRAGLAAVTFLRAHGAAVWAWDDDAPARAKAAELGATLQDLRAWPADAECLVLSPGVPFAPRPHPVVRAAHTRKIPIVGDMDLFQWTRPPDVPVLAITGTNGKSTACALAVHVLDALGYEARLGGNIGVSVLALAPPKRHGVYVLELSSYQLELVRDFAPECGALTNLTPDHLARHGTMARYVAAKEKLLAALPPDGTAVLGVDDAPTRALAARWANKPDAPALRRVSAYGERADIMFDGRHVRDAHGRALLDMTACPALMGAHNAQNAAIVYALLTALQGIAPAPQPITAERLADAFASFPGLDHRLQPLGELDGVRIINDSKATNAEASAVALAAFAEDAVYWIAGGRAKEGGFDALNRMDAVRGAWLIGESGQVLADWLQAQGVDCTCCATLPRAFADALAAARAAPPTPRRVLLFSPACASFDQYEDFAARGRAFCQLADAALKEGAA